MRPAYTRRPSHTPSPPCTAESNGEMPGSSRCRSTPLTQARMPALRSSSDWSIRLAFPHEDVPAGRRWPAGTSRSGEIEPIEVHHLVPRGHEVTHELLLCVVARVDL